MRRAKPYHVPPGASPLSLKFPPPRYGCLHLGYLVVPTRRISKSINATPDRKKTITRNDGSGIPNNRRVGRPQPTMGQRTQTPLDQPPQPVADYFAGSNSGVGDRRRLGSGEGRFPGLAGYNGDGQGRPGPSDAVTGSCSGTTANRPTGFTMFATRHTPWWLGEGLVKFERLKRLTR